MIEKIVPINDKIYVKPIEVMASKTIILAESSKERPIKGEIVAVGPDVKDVAVGDIIIFDNRGYDFYKDTETNITYLIMDLKGVLAKIEESEG